MKCFIGIDLGGTVIKVGLVRGGSVIATRRITADASRKMRLMMPQIEKCVDALLQENSIDLGGVALAFPGIVDFEKKRAAATNAKYDDAPDIDLGQWISSRWSVPFVMDNDARMAVIGEWSSGAGKGVGNMVMMTIGTGIGTGAIVDGRPVYGRNGCAGSLGGHLVVDYRGRRCTCGNIGCVEALSSSFFLSDIIKENGYIDGSFAADRCNCDFKMLFGLYRAGDRNARIVVNDCMDVWAAAIVNYIHAYNPEMVVVGGGVMKSADIIIPYLQQKVDSLAWSPGGKVPVVPSVLGDNAALLAAEYYFQSSNR